MPTTAAAPHLNAAWPSVARALLLLASLQSITNVHRVSASSLNSPLLSAPAEWLIPVPLTHIRPHHSRFFCFLGQILCSKGRVAGEIGEILTCIMKATNGCEKYATTHSPYTGHPEMLRDSSGVSLPCVPREYLMYPRLCCVIQHVMMGEESHCLWKWA